MGRIYREQDSWSSSQKEVEMGDVHEDARNAAKEITLGIMSAKEMLLPEERTVENIGETYGKLYKILLKHVREAAIDKKYD